MKNRFVVQLIESYQSNNNGRPPKCRFYPTCSHYALECYQKFNFFKASFLTLWRLIRCNPFHKYAYDPVPLSKKEKERLKKSDEELFIKIEKEGNEN